MAEQVILAGDVGGTNARLALQRVEGSSLTTLFTQHYPSTGPGLEALIQRFLAEGPRVSIAAAAVAVAGPVLDGRCEATNLPWVIDERVLAKVIGAPTTLLNDLQSLAFGIQFLPADQLVSLNGLPHPGRGNAAVIAAGTGLGQALLIWDGTRYHPVATEGSHGEYGPRNEVELGLSRYLIQKFGHPSSERAVSGPGFSVLYDYLRDTGLEVEPPELAAELARGDRNAKISQYGLERRYPLCAKAMDLFVDSLGSEAGNMALRCLATGGIYVGGGIPPKILPALKTGRFLEAFCDKGRFQRFCHTVPVSVVVAEQTGLQGASHYARLKLG